MAKITSISTKIKLVGFLLIFLIIGIISTTIYLNNQTSKDSLVVNIVGKQRMLTQKMAKYIFYTYYTKSYDFYELNSAVDEFIKSINILQYGDKERGIYPVPSSKINFQLLDVKKQWKEYLEYIQNYKILVTQTKTSRRDTALDMVVQDIYKSNSTLLDNVDKLVTLYTNNSEEKTYNIKLAQYISLFIFLIIFIYSLLQLRSIESHVDSFMLYSKKLISSKNKSKLQPMKLVEESEVEIVEVGNTINCFIDKINSAMDYSNDALLQSQNASSKLEELTDQFDSIIGEISDSSLSGEHLSNSEDMMIESTEELINSTKKLQKLKLQLQELTKSCQPKP